MSVKWWRIERREVSVWAKDFEARTPQDAWEAARGEAPDETWDLTEHYRPDENERDETQSYADALVEDAVRCAECGEAPGACECEEES